MQEVTWVEKQEEESNDLVGFDEENKKIKVAYRNEKVNSLSKITSMCGNEINYLMATEGEDTIAIRTIEKIILGLDYILVA